MELAGCEELFNHPLYVRCFLPYHALIRILSWTIQVDAARATFINDKCED